LAIGPELQLVVRRSPRKILRCENMPPMSDSSFSQAKDAAHGGEGWSPRTTSTAEELGSLWAPCGVTSEAGCLKSVLLHRPGAEVSRTVDFQKALWLGPIDLKTAQEQHDSLVRFYRERSIQVTLLPDESGRYPNLMFCRDLFAMTPQGAILSRPASAVRAGEERIVAEALLRMGVPILLSVYGDATFEGADLLIVNSHLAFVGEGIRTNHRGAELVADFVRSMGIDEVHVIQLNYGCGHLDGVLSIVDDDLAIVYPTQLSYLAWRILRDHGFTLLELPDDAEARAGMALNVVTLKRRHVLMPAGNPQTRRLLEQHGVTCDEIDVSELMRGGGAVHCLTGVIGRDGL
jgi:N-dimethylarginine dimethylaminohydrolase